MFLHFENCSERRVKSRSRKGRGKGGRGGRGGERKRERERGWGKRRGRKGVSRNPFSRKVLK